MESADFPIRGWGASAVLLLITHMDPPARCPRAYAAAVAQGRCETQRPAEILRELAAFHANGGGQVTWHGDWTPNESATHSCKEMPLTKKHVGRVGSDNWRQGADNWRHGDDFVVSKAELRRHRNGGVQSTLLTPALASETDLSLRKGTATTTSEVADAFSGSCATCADTSSAIAATPTTCEALVKEQSGSTPRTIAIEWLKANMLSDDSDLAISPMGSTAVRKMPLSRDADNHPAFPSSPTFRPIGGKRSGSPSPRKALWRVVRSKWQSGSARATFLRRRQQEVRQELRQQKQAQKRQEQEQKRLLSIATGSPSVCGSKVRSYCGRALSLTRLPTTVSDSSGDILSPTISPTASFSPSFTSTLSSFSSISPSLASTFSSFSSTRTTLARRESAPEYPPRDVLDMGGMTRGEAAGVAVGR